MMITAKRTKWLQENQLEALASKLKTNYLPQLKIITNGIAIDSTTNMTELSTLFAGYKKQNSEFCERIWKELTQ